METEKLDYEPGVQTTHFRRASGGTDAKAITRGQCMKKACGKAQMSRSNPRLGKLAETVAKSRNSGEMNNYNIWGRVNTAFIR